MGIGRRNFSCCKSDECKSVINGIKFETKTILNNLPSSSIETRHCDKYMFNVLICENLRDISSLKQISGKTFKKIGSSVTKRPFSDKKRIVERYFLKVYIYIFFLRRDSEHSEVINLSKYSNIFKAWENLVCLDFRVDFCACVLIDKIYMIGGEDVFCNNFDFCIHYNSKTTERKKPQVWKRLELWLLLQSTEEKL